MGFIGTTKVVPCYKAASQIVFPQLVKPVPFKATTWSSTFAEGQSTCGEKM